MSEEKEGAIRKLNQEISELELTNRKCLDTIKKNNRLIVTKKRIIYEISENQLTFEIM